MKNKLLIFIGSFAAIAAGLIHIFIIALGHGSVPPHLIAFMLGGTLQIMLGVFIWFENFVHHTFLAKSVIHGGFIFMLLFSLFLPVPFLGTTETLGTIGIVTLVLQIVAILSLIPSFIKKTEFNFIKTAFASFFIALLAGSSAFAIGYLAEDIFPEMKSSQMQGMDHHEGGGSTMMDHHGKVEKMPMINYQEEIKETSEEVIDDHAGSEGHNH